MISVAFNRRLNPLGATLKPVFGSDIGHWDVLDAASVLTEAWGLVTPNCMTPDEFPRPHLRQSRDDAPLDEPRLFQGHRRRGRRPRSAQTNGRETKRGIDGFVTALSWAAANL